jgi:hypothetical protein
LSAWKLLRAGAWDLEVKTPAEPSEPTGKMFRFWLMLAALAASTLVGLLVIVRAYVW